MVKVGIVGAGSFTNRILLPAYTSIEGVEVAAIADINPEAARSTASKFDIERAFFDPIALFNSETVDAVHIAVPPAHSPDITEAAIDAGMHVISEKPVATSVERARGLAERASKAGVITAVDHEMRYDPVIGKMRWLVAEGFVGQPRLVNVNAILCVGIDPESPLRFRTWFDTHSLGGGFSQMVLSHVVDLTRYIFGDFELLAEASKQTMAAKPNVDNPNEMIPCAADDVTALVGQIPSGGLAALSGGWVLSHGGGMRWDIRGDKGSLMLDRDRFLYGGRSDQPLEKIGGEHSERSIVATLKSTEEWLPLIVGLVSDFVGAIRGESGPFTFSTFDDGVRVLESVAAIGARYDSESGG